MAKLKGRLDTAELGNRNSLKYIKNILRVREILKTQNKG